MKFYITIATVFLLLIGVKVFSQKDARWLNLSPDKTFIHKEKISFSQQSYPQTDFCGLNDYIASSDIKDVVITSVSFSLVLSKFNDFKNGKIDSLIFFKNG
ncbi:MAG TPA: hypothetical protein PKD51_16020, partial [Saprospiraceae bacterium]|nr:hypothetical protein [Saprospiraceae bacterium]